MGGLGGGSFYMTPSIQSPLALGHRMRETLGRGRDCLHPFQMAHVFSHLMYHERSFFPLLHVFISFLFTFSVVNVTLLKAPPAY